MILIFVRLIKLCYSTISIFTNFIKISWRPLVLGCNVWKGENFANSIMPIKVCWAVSWWSHWRIRLSKHKRVSSMRLLPQGWERALLPRCWIENGQRAYLPTVVIPVSPSTHSNAAKFSPCGIGQKLLSKSWSKFRGPGSTLVLHIRPKCNLGVLWCSTLPKVNNFHSTILKTISVKNQSRSNLPWTTTLCNSW